MEFTTRLCRSGDEQALSLVAQATILETYAGITDGRDLVQYVTAELSVADFSAMMASDRVRVWIAETVAGECAVGYAVTVSDEGAKPFSSFELKRLYIFYRFHGKGLGGRLMEDVLSFARQLKSEKIWLQVHEANTHAIEFYKRFGFYPDRGRSVSSWQGFLPSSDSRINPSALTLVAIADQRLMQVQRIRGCFREIEDV
jgi:ribosomal protein S18 acetylase RimI-like enzyme